MQENNSRTIVSTTADQSQFRKYLDRVRDIINNNHPKIAFSHVSVSLEFCLTNRIAGRGVEND